VPGVPRRTGTHVMKIGGGADPWASLRGSEVPVRVRCGLPRHRDSEPCRNERETCRWHGTGRGATRARARGTGPGRQPALFDGKPNSRDVPGFSGRPDFSASRSARRRSFSRSEGRGDAVHIRLGERGSAAPCGVPPTARCCRVPPGACPCSGDSAVAWAAPLLITA
jgi:hypothetical protein